MSEPANIEITKRTKEDSFDQKIDRKEPLIVMRLADALSYRGGGDNAKPKPT